MEVCHALEPFGKKILWFYRAFEPADFWSHGYLKLYAVNFGNDITGIWFLAALCSVPPSLIWGFSVRWNRSIPSWVSQVVKLQNTSVELSPKEGKWAWQSNVFLSVYGRKKINEPGQTRLSSSNIWKVFAHGEYQIWHKVDPSVRRLS